MPTGGVPDERLEKGMTLLGLLGRLGQRHVLLPQSVLGLLPLGDVPDDHGKPDVAVAFVQSRHRVDRPEGGAVLPGPDSLLFVSAVSEGGVHVPLGFPAAGVLGGEHRGERLAQHLVGGVALDPLGPGVPAGDPALRVEHVDGVVPDALDQQPERVGGMVKQRGREPGRIVGVHNGIPPCLHAPKSGTVVDDKLASDLRTENDRSYTEMRNMVTVANAPIRAK